MASYARTYDNNNKIIFEIGRDKQHPISQPVAKSSVQYYIVWQERLSTKDLGSVVKIGRHSTSSERRWLSENYLRFFI